MITKFGKQVHLQDFTLMRLIRQVHVISLHLGYVTKQKNYKLDRLLPLKTYNPLILWSCKIM